MKTVIIKIGSLKLVFLFIVAAVMSGCRKDPLTTMPAFNLMLADRSIINTGELPAGQPYIFIHFDATCKGCQDETDVLLQHMDKLKNVRLYFLTIDNLESVKLFTDYYKMKRFPNITLGLDYERYFPRHFHSATTPLLAIYDKEKKLRGVFEGQANTEKLLATIKQIN